MKMQYLRGFLGRSSQTFAASLLAILLNFGFPSRSPAAVSFEGNYSQDFNTLVTSGTAQVWGNNPGWYLFQSTGMAITTYQAGTGSVNTGSFYSFGSGTASDRALGGVASGGTYFGSPATGAVAGYIAVALQNGTGATLPGFTVSFDGEQWRNAGNTSVQTMVMEFGFGDTFAAVNSWTAPGAGFNFASPVVGATGAAVDGNVAGRVAGLGGAIPTPWNSGETLWIRWIERNDDGNDHGLAIDNFSITAVPVPEPSTYLGGLLLVLPLGAAAIRRFRCRQGA